jgi:hypothetical protein
MGCGYPCFLFSKWLLEKWGIIVLRPPTNSHHGRQPLTEILGAPRIVSGSFDAAIARGEFRVFTYPCGHLARGIL